MFQAPDPFIQTLEDHILHCPIPFKLRHCQIIFRIIAPDTGKGAMLNIRNRQVETQLKLVVQRNRIVCPAVCFVVCTALTLQNSRFTVTRPLESAVEVGQCIRMIRVLIKACVFVDMVSGLLCIPIGCNRLQKMAHLKLICVGLLRRLHSSLLDEPQFQRRGPGGYSEDRCHITAADGVWDITFRAVHTALKPPFITHSCGIAEHNGSCHQ